MSLIFFFFFNDTATTEIYTLSLHDALPIGGIPSAPAVTGTKARIGGTKRAKNTARVPQRWKNASLCAITPGYLDIGQTPRISRCERWPVQNAEPSPSM